MDEQKVLLEKQENCLSPVDLHDQISTGFSNIKNVIRQESAKITEAMYDQIQIKAPKNVISLRKDSDVEEIQELYKAGFTFEQICAMANFIIIFMNGRR